MDLGLKDKLALIVGATGNTGRAVALALAQEGCRLALIARGAERLYAVGKEVGGLTIPADITDQAQLGAALDAIPRDIGVPDVIVHVAGGSMGIKDWRLSSADWAKVWQLNIGAAIDINRAFTPAMIQRGWGRIVHFSSNGTKLAIGNAPYTSAKHAVEGYVRTVSKELGARGVVVTAVRPGPIFTEGRFLYSQPDAWRDDFFAKYVPMNRWGNADELAAVVAVLCSQRASYMAGAIVDVDGGMR